jgi:5-methylcytosine-specific restriction endonuclease McrA
MVRRYKNTSRYRPTKDQKMKCRKPSAETGRAEATPLRNDSKMKCRKNSVEQVWKQLEDVMVPRLRLSLTDRAVYCHLLRHSRLEGKIRYRFSIAWLGRGTRLSGRPVRMAVRRLVEHGALRLLKRSKAGHVVEVRLPEEIRGVRRYLPMINEGARVGDWQARAPQAGDLEGIDFTQTKALRQAIHAREGGRCFYCLRRLSIAVNCVDHVAPLARAGRNSYRNLVSACLECNSQKGERAAEDFLRWLYRERRLTGGELNRRLSALHALAAGKLRPAMQETRR